MLMLVGVAVALATYPIVRRLTKRLEALQSGVERWGSGDLSARVAVSGSDEVGFLAARFNHAAERIETLVKTHKSLLANASHELRSPLTRIRMGLELMGAGNPSSAQREEIERSITELDELIGEILLASRLDSPEADVGSVELVDLAGLVAEECAHAGAALDAQSVSVQGVPKLLRRLVRNLLENARRYSSGPVAVTLSTQGGTALLRVCDQGPGVQADQRERIFEPFYRLPGASERDGGVGLGLALVKSIALRHGGNVRCEEPAQGSGPGACFSVHLPMNLVQIQAGQILT
jgi:signal transduction histidine kinase